MEEISSADEGDENLDSAGEEAHADRAEDHEGVVLALMVAVFRQGIE